MRENCKMRHENGNCLPCGGFCTAVKNEICTALHQAYDAGMERAMDLWEPAEQLDHPQADCIFRNGNAIRLTSAEIGKIFRLREFTTLQDDILTQMDSRLHMEKPDADTRRKIANVAYNILKKNDDYWESYWLSLNAAIKQVTGKEVE